MLQCLQWHLQKKVHQLIGLSNNLILYLQVQEDMHATVVYVVDTLLVHESAFMLSRSLKHQQTPDMLLQCSLLTTYLKAIEEVIREDGPAAPHAEHAQHVPPQPLLCHTAVTCPVSFLQQAH